MDAGGDFGSYEVEREMNMDISSTTNMNNNGLLRHENAIFKIKLFFGNSIKETVFLNLSVYRFTISKQTFVKIFYK